MGKKSISICSLPIFLLLLFALPSISSNAQKSKSEEKKTASKSIKHNSELNGLSDKNSPLIKPQLHDSLFSTYYHQKVSHFKYLTQTNKSIVFVGNSITDGGEWNVLFDNLNIINQGISGDISAGIIHRIETVVKNNPAKVFLMIGTNDLARGISVDSILKNIYWISEYIHEQSPATKLYVQSILPVNDVFKKFTGHTNKGAQIKFINESLQKHATQKNYTFIDLHSNFIDASGKLDTRYTNDGLHLTGEAYLLWKNLLYPSVYDLQSKPSLLPLPQKLSYTNERFPLTKLTSISINDPSLAKEKEWLLNELKSIGINVSAAPNEVESKRSYENSIQLLLDKVDVPQNQNEAYQLKVTGNNIRVIANTSRGIFFGLQTLKQLMRDKVFVEGCEITDWPSFQWRGYMIDVGRNYMSMDLLRQQIDVMSRYKYNIFHFHFTEDIAWRLAIKQYPQLTAPENMLRDKGQYYTEAEMKELINYCKERYITLVPEIDMPGHSAAFTRAFGFNMQSDSGIVIVKNILKEFIETYDLEYVHIGADEVKITNKNFIPEVTAFIQSFGKKVIGWEPGGNFSDNTIRQMWMDDNGAVSRNKNIQYIDSKHLYLNHMDPLEAVVTIFNRQITGNEKGDENALGGTLCMWHDRKVGKQEDVLNMNPVYPGMLAFSERVWRGGGRPGWTATIGAPESEKAKDFESFEKRILDHKKLYFSSLPFTYAKQSSTAWKLYGPYENNGDLKMKFEPELPNWNAPNKKAAHEVVGGTIILRHWWAPLIDGAIKDPKENTTWYASTRIWSDEEGPKKFWIGFNNLSRSPATDSPPVGAWDNKSGAVWVNGNMIDPPVWKRGGQTGHPEIPLTDEGYEFRDPAIINMKKGWNEVLVKIPVGTFKGRDWQNPVKWMFTFIEVK